ncbi:ferritin-like domain-containing protein [Lederbergia wuyishanensis]|uniref:Bacterioferritin n=1 Tax=Lederbergia wuyishanensis TaxID=1347903 RepID=A0ABU0D6L4_9BACI|nr:ferritin-like domain-containing protein [Lederbergia wuyishanensis]MCJ8008529.1 ferritin-like domain-containing protein [Lederbergia wuyishanensis]MDQ0344057.1 bacterioferritin [Lederbergia wuyishanensis]
MNKDNIVKELNAYLKGEYMAIHSYEHYIQRITNPTVKKALQKIQQEHKQHAAKTAERIQNLGGKPVDFNGIMLSIMEGMKILQGIPHSTYDILKDAIKGQEMGINKTEEIVRGDLDQESLQIVNDNLNEDRMHIDQLYNFISE